MGRICTEIEENNMEFFRVICDNLKIETFEQFEYIAKQVFVNDDEDHNDDDNNNNNNNMFVTWGRIATLLTFCGKMGEQGNANVPCWTVRFVDRYLEDWIKRHDGWDGFVDFFSPTPMPVSKPMIVGLGIIGLLCIITMLKNK
ncbi:apoptosis regulator Bcl-2-like [Anneissia japonica]|uniref:apoptosis regulator Bcl-2-like n=1 Tax=Anneissia japonica TaxID=1529436 RepID=UPI001425B59D|nr:apoptosis regulator Bcl-2-like [Anneissia japonica]